MKSWKRFQLTDLAGGSYVFDDLGDPETRTSTVTIEMEKFFSTARDADYIIYNSTIGGEIKSIDELLAKNELLAEFKAVQNGNVWCTSENMYQETTQLGQLLNEGGSHGTNDDTDDLRTYILYNCCGMQLDCAGDITQEAGNAEAHVGRVASSGKSQCANTDHDTGKQYGEKLLHNK